MCATAILLVRVQRRDLCFRPKWVFGECTQASGQTPAWWLYCGSYCDTKTASLLGMTLGAKIMFAGSVVRHPIRANLVTLRLIVGGLVLQDLNPVGHGQSFSDFVRFIHAPVTNLRALLLNPVLIPGLFGIGVTCEFCKGGYALR